MNIRETDELQARYEADERERARRHEETRPKNAGTHSDQEKRLATRRNRRAERQKGWDENA